MRIRMITRNVTINYTTALAYDVEEKKTQEVNFAVVGNYTNSELEKIAKKKIDSEYIKFIAVLKNDTVEQIYGMPEEVFVEYAKPIER